jgi:signal transduction histidine kinase
MANFEVKMKRMNNEEFFGALNTQKVAGDDGKTTHIQGFIRDISAEKQMRELNERMQRLEALGQLAAGLAHEIRNPIASMKLNLQFLQRKYQSDDFFQENIGEVFEGMLRVEKIMEQTLYFSGKKRPTLIPENVMPLINRSIELIKMELFDLNSDIIIKCPDDFPNLMLDKQQFLQVLVNLIKNSLQSIDNRGKIKINCYLKNIDKEQKAVIDIIDNGKGMTEEECNRVFNPFFTTKSSGVGLGLSIVYKILGQHYASIDLKSKINKGTTFSLIFPLKIPEEN